jgi:DNA-binding NtrC family response regulator
MPAPVLVVHNEDETRERALAALRAAGHEVIGFSDPTAALNAIEAASRVRVVVTRVNFGERKLNGVALARMLKIKRLGVSMVFILRPRNLHFAADLGECLPAPFDAEALVEAVARVFSRSDDGPDQ